MKYYKFSLKVIDPSNDNSMKTHILYEAGTDYSKILRDVFESAISLCEALSVDFYSITDEEVTTSDMKIIKRIEKKLGSFNEILWE